MTMDGFRASFSNIVLYSTNDGHRKRGKFKLNSIFKKDLQENQRLLISVFFLSLVAQSLSLLIPFVIQRIIDGMEQTILEYFTLFGIAIFVLLWVYFLVNMVRTRMLVKLQTSIDSSLLSKIIAQLLDLPYSYFVNRSKGELIYRINSNAYIRQLLVDQLLDLVLSVCFMIFYLGAMFLFNSVLSLFTLGIAVFLVLFSVMNAKINQKILHNQMVVMTKSQELAIGIVVFLKIRCQK